MIVNDLIDGRVTLAGLKPETLGILRHLSNVHNQITNISSGIPTVFEALNKFLENVHSDAERRFCLNGFCAFYGAFDMSSSELLKQIANNFCMLLKDSSILPKIFYSGEEIIQFLTHNSIDENQAEALYSYIWSSDAIVSENGKQTFKEIFKHYESLPDRSYRELFLNTFNVVCFKVPQSESDNNSFNVDEYFDFSHGDLEYNREGGHALSNNSSFTVDSDFTFHEPSVSVLKHDSKEVAKPLYTSNNLYQKSEHEIQQSKKRMTNEIKSCNNFGTSYPELTPQEFEKRFKYGVQTRSQVKQTP